MLDSHTVDTVDRILSSKAAKRAARAMSVAWMAVIFALSSVPGTAVPSRFGEVAHVGVYALLGALLYAAVRSTRRDLRAAATAVLLAAAYAVTDELHQAFVPGRMPDIADWGLDVLGAALGAFAIRATDGKKAA